MFSTPSLTALRVLEAAERHGSFTRAAADLAMTQSAVSYQIRLLEDRVGTPLFVRLPRGVASTETGKRLAHRTRDALAGLQDAFNEAMVDGRQSLSLSVVPTFAEKVLAPRLGRFQVANPDLTVRLDISQILSDVAGGGVDLAVRFGRGAWPGLRAERLLENRLAPMLSPALAAEIGGVGEPSDLLKLPLVDPGNPWWPRWFAALGVPFVPATADSGMGMVWGAQTLDAGTALAGLGVAALSPTLFADELAAGRLIQPFRTELADESGFWLVSSPSRRNSAKIRAFRDWIVDETAAMVAPGSRP